MKGMFLKNKIKYTNNNIKPIVNSYHLDETAFLAINLNEIYQITTFNRSNYRQTISIYLIIPVPYKLHFTAQFHYEKRNYSNQR